MASIRMNFESNMTPFNHSRRSYSKSDHRHSSGRLMYLRPSAPYQFTNPTGVCREYYGSTFTSWTCTSPSAYAPLHSYSRHSWTCSSGFAPLNMSSITSPITLMTSFISPRQSRLTTPTKYFKQSRLTLAFPSNPPN